jgi:hypothetical protein
MNGSPNKSPGTLCKGLIADSHLRRKATRVPGAIHGDLQPQLKRGDTMYRFRLLDTFVYFLS